MSNSKSHFYVNFSYRANIGMRISCRPLGKKALRGKTLAKHIKKAGPPSAGAPYFDGPDEGCQDCCGHTGGLHNIGGPDLYIKRKGEAPGIAGKRKAMESIEKIKNRDIIEKLRS